MSVKSWYQERKEKKKAKKSDDVPMELLGKPDYSATGYGDASDGYSKAPEEGEGRRNLPPVDRELYEGLPRKAENFLRSVYRLQKLKKKSKKKHLNFLNQVNSAYESSKSEDAKKDLAYHGVTTQKSIDKLDAEISRLEHAKIYVLKQGLLPDGATKDYEEAINDYINDMYENDKQIMEGTKVDPLKAIEERQRYEMERDEEQAEVDSFAFGNPDLDDEVDDYMQKWEEMRRTIDVKDKKKKAKRDLEDELSQLEEE